MSSIGTKTRFSPIQNDKTRYREETVIRVKACLGIGNFSGEAGERYTLRFDPPRYDTERQGTIRYCTARNSLLRSITGSFLF